MPTQTISANACLKIVEAATQSCQAPVVPQATPPNPNWDAIAVSLTSQSNAIAWGALVLTVIFALTGLAWGKMVTRNAEREARKKAEDEVQKWLAGEGFPFIRREMEEWRKTFPQEPPISEDLIGDMVAAAGLEADNGKEGEDGEK